MSEHETGFIYTVTHTAPNTILNAAQDDISARELSLEIVGGSKTN
jgi:hypothetical protein